MRLSTAQSTHDNMRRTQLLGRLRNTVCMGRAAGDRRQRRGYGRRQLAGDARLSQGKVRPAPSLRIGERVEQHAAGDSSHEERVVQPALDARADPDLDPRHHGAERLHNNRRLRHVVRECGAALPERLGG
jgi:hypothetical protein